MIISIIAIAQVSSTKVKVEFITPKIDVFGCRIISFEELSECFDWLIDDSNTHVRH